MVTIKRKEINGNTYLYGEYSFRLPNGKIKKISKLVKRESDVGNQDIKAYFFNKEKEANYSYALNKYVLDSIFTKEIIGLVEGIRVEYKRLVVKLTKKQFQDMIDRFTVNFTYESNAIEGNSLTLKDVTLILTENVVPKNKDLREVYETKNTRVANELLFKRKIKISEEEIIKIHKILVRDTGVSVGYKKFPNFLVMRNVKTTLPDMVVAEMKELIEWYAKNKEDMHPLKLATEFHARFERIHPFEDGNGRVGRVLINAILIEHGLPPVIIRKTMRVSYFSALEAFDGGHKSLLERFVIEKFKKTFKDFFQMYVAYL